MPGTILYSTQFNPAGLTASGVYTDIIPPPPFAPNLPSGVLAIIGTASYGPVNVPQLIGDFDDIATIFGGITAGSFADVFDLPTAATIALQQAGPQGALQIWGVRVTDGTDVAATVGLKDTATPTPATGITLTALKTGTGGDSITVSVSAGALTGTFNVAITGPGTITELYQNLAYTTAGSFWTNLSNALTNGQGSQRPPSALVKASNPSATAVAPATGTFSLTGGTDGRTGITSAELIGSPTATPSPTGIYSLPALSPQPQGFFCAGLTDSTVAATILAFVQSQPIIGSFGIAQGQTDAQAISLKQTDGLANQNLVICKDWILWYDPVNGQTKFVDPQAAIMGMIFSLSPEISPGNKPLAGVVGTERNSPQTGYQPRSLASIGLLQQNGILFATNPIERGNVWGLWHGSNTSTNMATAEIPYARMTNYIAQILTTVAGQFVYELQTDSPQDATRANLKLAFSNALQLLENQKQIADFLVVCTGPPNGNNTAQSIAQGYLYADVYVQLLAPAKWVIARLQAGPQQITVSVSPTNAPGG